MIKLLLIMLSSSLLMMSCSPTNQKSSASQQRTADKLKAVDQGMAMDETDQVQSSKETEDPRTEVQKPQTERENILARKNKLERDKQKVLQERDSLTQKLKVLQETYDDPDIFNKISDVKHELSLVTPNLDRIDRQMRQYDSYLANNP